MFPLRAASCRLCAMIRTVSPLSLHTPAAPFSSMPTTTTTTTTTAPTQTSSSYFDRESNSPRGSPPPAVTLVSTRCSLCPVPPNRIAPFVVGTGSPERGEGTKKENRIHLWQIFFANPFEWWDKRKNKAHKSSPDFKHKDTGESLWLNPRDPPWIREQLDLLDSRIATDQGMHRHISSHPRLSKWEYE